MRCYIILRARENRVVCNNSISVKTHRWPYGPIWIKFFMEGNIGQRTTQNVFQRATAIFRCVLASLYEVVSVGRLVRRSLCNLFFLNAENELFSL